MQEFELLSDKALVSSKDDRLGRTNFAKRLAKCIASYSQPSSLVIGLMGDWGSGKSTLLNFTKEHLNQGILNEDSIVLDFNPWLFSTHEDLVSLFLQELLIKLTDKSNVVRDKIKEFRKAFKSIELSGFGFGVGTSWELPDSQRQSLTDLKEAVSKSLVNEKIHFLIVFDDIDRLTPEEIRCIFRLIKSVCDFTNIIYLLSFDKKVVVDALEELHRGKGESYLEKIVQIPIIVPSANKIDLEKIFLEKLENLLGSFIFSNFDESSYWFDIYETGIKPYLRTTRDINRLVNCFAFPYAGIKDEVNWIDFLAISSLKVFNTALYYEILDKKDKFLGTFISSFQYEREESKAFFEDIFSRYARKGSENIRVFLRNLFPQITGNNHAAEVKVHWRKTLRVCSKEAFDYYFELTVHQNAISNTTLQNLISQSSFKDTFSEAFLNDARLYFKDDRVSRLLSRLSDFVDSFHSSVVVIESLFSIGDQLTSSNEELDRNLILSLRVGDKIRYLICEIFRQTDLSNKQFSILLQSLKNCKSISTIVCFIDYINGENVENLDPLSPQEIEELKKISLQRIRDSVKAGDLIKLPELHQLLFIWKNWSNDESEISSWIQSILNNDEYLYRFFLAFSKTGSTNAKIYYLIHLKDLSAFINPLLLKERIHSLLKNDVVSKEEIFREALGKLMEDIKKYEIENSL